MSYGMATMTHRATFALDAGTISRLKKLSTLWHTSQAEVVRRSLEMAEKTHSQGKEITHRLDAVARLRDRIQGRSLDVDTWIRTARDSRR
jgi:hypothetical protein